MNSAATDASTRKAAVTAKGQRTRGQIVRAAAELMHRKGVGATTLADVRDAAQVSSSQLYYYFADKQALIRNVVKYQADVVVHAQHERDLSTLAGLRSWRDDLVGEEQGRHGRGGCPLGSLGADLAETDPAGRRLAAAGFDRWAGEIEHGLARMQQRGDLPAEADTGQLALGLLACLQGGLLLGQVQRSAAPLRAALDNAILLLESLTAHPPTPR